MNENLRQLSESISKSELNKLALSGFEAPNDFKIIHLKNLIKTISLPSINTLNEFCWAINESEISEIKKLSIHIRIYIYIIALYAHRQTECIDALDEKYLYLIVSDIKFLTTNERKNLLNFFYWFEKYIPFPDKLPPNNDVFLFLTILSLILEAGDKAQINLLLNIISKLYKAGNNSQVISSMSDNYEERWLKILQDLGANNKISSELTDIFTG